VQLDGREPEHLSESDAQQREIDAPPVRQEAGDNGAAYRRAEDGREQAEPDAFQHVELRESESVGAEPEERAVPEGRQPRVAEQHVEAQRVDHPDHDLDAEVLVQADRPDPQRQADEHGEKHNHLPGEPSSPRGGCGAHGQLSRMLFLPNRPRARTVTTAISNRYMLSSDHSEA
jgi:hypothetical protein